MAQRLDDWFNSLTEAYLPVRPSTRVALEQMAGAGMEDLGVRDLHPMLVRDPAFALNILRSANAFRHRHLDGQTTTADQAALMLGTARTLDLAAQWPCASESMTDDARAGYRQVMADACFTARLAAYWAELRSDVLPAEIYCAALARHSGSLALQAHPEGRHRMDAINEIRERCSIEPPEAEYVVLGFGVDELATVLNTNWRLPTLALEYLLPENINARRTLGIRLAMQLRRIGHLGWFSPGMKRLLPALAKYLGTDRDKAADTIPGIARAVLEEYPKIENPRWLPLADNEAPPAHEPPPRGLCLMPQRDLMERLIGELEDGRLERIEHELARRHDRTDPDAAVLTLAARALHHGLGLNRAVIFLMNQELDAMTPYVALGADTDPALLATTVRVEGGWLEQHFPAGGGARCLRSGETSELRQQLRAAGGHLFDTQEYLIRLVRGPGSALALVFGDRHAPECRLNDAARQGFSRITQILESAWNRQRSTQ